MKGQDPKGKIQQKSCQRLRGNTQEPAVPSQPASAKRQTPEHTPCPSRKVCSPAQPGPPAAATETALPPPPHENAQQALHNEEQKVSNRAQRKEPAQSSG